MGQMSEGMQDALRQLVSKAYLARVKGDGRPFVVGHFITNRCNCQCASCLWKHNDWQDVPLEDIKRFYTEAREQGFLAAAFSGGDPFLRKDLGEILRFVKHEKKMSILLFTTGWFLKARMDEALPHIDMLMLSLDSAKAERHDRIRGLPGLYDRLVEAVGLVRKRYPTLSVQFNTCVQKGISEEVDDLIALARSLDVHISFDVITDSRNGDADAPFTQTNMGLPQSELKEVCSYLLKRKQEGAPILNSEHYFSYFIAGKPGYACHLPKLAMSVDGRGYVEYCLNLNEPIANIRTMSVKEILDLPRFKSLRADAERCSSCSSPTMVDFSGVWENPQMVFEKGGISIR